MECVGKLLEFCHDDASVQQNNGQFIFDHTLILWCPVTPIRWEIFVFCCFSVMMAHMCWFCVIFCCSDDVADFSLLDVAVQCLWVSELVGAMAVGQWWVPLHNKKTIVHKNVHMTQWTVWLWGKKTFCSWVFGSSNRNKWPKQERTWMHFSTNLLVIYRHSCSASLLAGTWFLTSM